MRLYRLLERHGRLKKRMYPWFEAPPVGSPMKYYGWNWDPAEREWVEVDVPRVEVEVQVPAYPRPEEPPRPAQPLDVPGWYWNGRVEVWEEAPMPLKRVQQEMERPLAPVGPPHEADPVRVSGWQWSDSMQEWVEVPLSRQDIAEGKERVPHPRYAPRPEVSWRVDGWVWSSVRKKWEESPMPLEWVEVEQERGPKPEHPPDTGVPTKPKGWTWSIEFKLWVADTFETAKAILNPPHTLPPGTDLETVRKAGVYEIDVKQVIDALQLKWLPMTGLTRVNIDSLQRMLEQSGMSAAKARSVMTGYVKLTAGLTAKEAAAVWKQAASTIIGTWHKTHLVSTTQGQEIWVDNVRRSFGIVEKGPLRMYVILALMYMATQFGLLIGGLLERLAFVDKEHIILVAPPNTYLLGPDWWLYSRHIGTSLGGRPFYSECEDIGTEYTRHKRGRWSGEPDTIDFLGGFLETGFQFPYWVKYLWSHWLVEYIGVLESAGPNFYKLKKPIYDPAARLPIGWSAPVSEWCKDFHYYL